MKDNQQEHRVDWLTFALARVGKGDMKVAARKLKVSESVIAGWLKRGTGKAQFERMVCLSNMSEVPLSMLARRLGPLPDALENMGGPAE